MGTERFAVTTILICVGVLLLSACGLPLRPAPQARVRVVATGYDVYTMDGTRIAKGSVSGTTDLQQIPGYLEFVDCREPRPVNVVGSLNGLFAVRSRLSEGPQVSLVAESAPTYQAAQVFVVPFTGRFTRTGGVCPGLSNVPVRVEKRVGTGG